MTRNHDDEPETLDEAIEWVTVDNPGTKTCASCGFKVPMPDKVPAFMHEGEPGMPAGVLMPCPRCGAQVWTGDGPAPDDGPSLTGWQQYREKPPRRKPS